LTDAARVDAARAVIGGRGFGGYVALRALQREATPFRAAIVINAPLDLADLWRVEIPAEQYRRAAEEQLALPIDPARRLQNQLVLDAQNADPSVNTSTQSVQLPPLPVGGFGYRPP